MIALNIAVRFYLIIIIIRKLHVTLCPHQNGLIKTGWGIYGRGLLNGMYWSQRFSPLSPSFPPPQTTSGQHGVRELGGYGGPVRYRSRAAKRRGVAAGKEIRSTSRY